MLRQHFKACNSKYTIISILSIKKKVIGEYNKGQYVFVICSVVFAGFSSDALASRIVDGKIRFCF